MLQILLPTFAIKRISTAICSGIENSKRRTLGTRAPASRKFFRQPTSILRLLYDPCVCVCFSLRWLILKISITLRDYWFYGFSFLFFLTNQIRIYDRDDIFFPSLLFRSMTNLSRNETSRQKSIEERKRHKQRHLSHCFDWFVTIPARLKWPRYYFGMSRLRDRMTFETNTINIKQGKLFVPLATSWHPSSRSSKIFSTIFVADNAT